MHSREVNKSKTVEIKKPLDGNKREKIQENQEEHLLKEANKVVNLLLDDVIEIVDEEEEFIEDVEEVTLDETCVDADLKEKKYWNKCENCNYVAIATNSFENTKILVQIRLNNPDAQRVVNVMFVILRIKKV